MSFAMFVTWVLVGVLAGVLAGVVMKRGGYGLKRDVTLGLLGSIGASWIFRAVGVFPEAGIAAMAVVASIGAAIPLVAQRKLWPAERPVESRAETWWRWGLGAAIVAVMAWMPLSPTQQPVAVAAVTEDKAYAVTPATAKIKAGIVTGELVNMKVTERIEPGSGRVVNGARLTGSIVLRNSATNQTVRLVGGKIRYMDAEGQPIPLEDNRTEPVLTFGGSDRLDPGQEAIQALDVEFPADALKARRLKHIRLDLTYLPAPYRQDTADLAVAIAEAK